MLKSLRIWRLALLGALALLSALLSNYEQLTPQAAVFGVPILPGFYFSLVITLATYLWADRYVFRSFMVMVLTIFAWMLAYRTTLYIYGTIDDEIHSMIPIQNPGSTNVGKFPVAPDYLIGMCGMVGGLVGSSITAFAVSVPAREFRTVANWTRTVLIGTLLGFLLEAYAPSSTSTSPYLLHIKSTLPLFICWQIAVAVSIAYGLGNKTITS